MSRPVTADRAEVFSAQEIAQAAGVSLRDVERLIGDGRIRTLDGFFAAAGEAVRAVRVLRGRVPDDRRELFQPHAAPERSPGRALLASGGLHAAMLAVLAVLSTMDLTGSAIQEPPKPVRLVFLATPGPGGGGGGGGLKQPAPAPKAQLKGQAKLRSPIPPPRQVVTRIEPPKRPPVVPPPVRPVPAPKPVEPPPPAPVQQPMPQVIAPVAVSPTDPKDRPGTLESASDANSHGSGTGGGTGTGQGTGMGEGDGAGIGPGSGGGTGGGPYRAGSGIAAPSLLHEVKPEYTQEARRRGVEGDVVLEIVVRRDGSVGDVKILQGLGAGLDQRAVDAVRQWRFGPARRHGTPVDVIVEVAVEFKLR
jgi:periplasmic protein TonB